MNIRGSKDPAIREKYPSLKCIYVNVPPVLRVVPENMKGQVLPIASLGKQ